MIVSQIQMNGKCEDSPHTADFDFERRVRRCIAQNRSRSVLDKCKSRGITSFVVENSSAEDLVSEMGISNMDAMALKQRDTDWHGSLAEVFTTMEEESGMPTELVEKAHEIVSGSAKNRQDLQGLGVEWMQNRSVPLAARCWLDANIFKAREDFQPIDQARMSADNMGGEQSMAVSLAGCDCPVESRDEDLVRADIIVGAKLTAAPLVGTCSPVENQGSGANVNSFRTSEADQMLEDEHRRRRSLESNVNHTPRDVCSSSQSHSPKDACSSSQSHSRFETAHDGPLLLPYVVGERVSVSSTPGTAAECSRGIIAHCEEGGGIVLTNVFQLQGIDGVKVQTWMVLGEVVGVHIRADLLVDGVYNTAGAGHILRGGGPADYFTIGPEQLFKMHRPR